MEQIDSNDIRLSRIRDLNDVSTIRDEPKEVKEEIILDTLAHQVSAKMKSVVSTNENNAGSAGIVTVPVSLPIGSMITGAAFNVITQEHLPHFKQMLCVDSNGYISGGTVVGNGNDLKAIVIQQQPNCGSTNHDGSGSNTSHESGAVPDHTGQCSTGSTSTVCWPETTHMEIFPVRCKTTIAELYRSKLGSGGRGRCVKYKDNWYTPSEFEHVCGRGSSKDWKRSIKYGGKSLQSLIDEGTLTPHATNCSCTVCCDDEAASGPVRLFTPYKRRKRHQTEIDQDVSFKRKRLINNGNNLEASTPTTVGDEMFITDDSITTKEEPWPTLNDSIDTTSELIDQSQTLNPYDRQTFLVNINESCITSTLDSSQVIKTLENVYCSMVKATNDFKRLFNVVKTSYERKIEVLRKERDTAVSAMRVQLHSDMDDPNTTGSLHENDTISAKKCANCNREALAECSLCRKTPYCSEFCQRKDWNAHQVECTRNPSEANQQVMLLVDEHS